MSNRLAVQPFTYAPEGQDRGVLDRIYDRLRKRHYRLYQAGFYRYTTHRGYVRGVRDALLAVRREGGL